LPADALGPEVSDGLVGLVQWMAPAA
jgi:hypothetical protein